MADERLRPEWAVDERGWIQAVPTERTEGRDWTTEEASCALLYEHITPPAEPVDELHQEHPGLFKTFAHTAPTRDGIWHFARRYGLLGIPSMVDWLPDRQCVMAEWGETWRDHIRAVKLTLDLHTALENSDHEALRSLYPEWIRRCAGLFVECAWPVGSGYTVVVLPSGVPEIQADSPEGLASGVRDTLANVLTCALKRQVHITVAPSPGPPYLLQNAFILQVATDNTLIATIWYQVAQAVTGHNEFRRCEGPGCDIWIQISLGSSGSKSSKRYCSDACRMKALRTRQRDARSRRQRGQSLRKIALALNTDTVTVKGWVTKRARST